MIVEISHPFEQMAEQLMYAGNTSSLSAAVEEAIAAMHRKLTEKQKTEALQKMVQAGFDSGVYPGDPIAEILERSRTSKAVEHDAHEAA